MHRRTFTQLCAATAATMSVTRHAPAQADDRQQQAFKPNYMLASLHVWLHVHW
ncbi:MAG: hypothetical protein R3C53_06075 [Pirellulaceae bacterium]